MGQAFQLAYNRFQNAKVAQMGFKDTKEKVRMCKECFVKVISNRPQLVSDLDKLDLAKRVAELQEQVKEMETQAEARDKPLKDEVGI